MGYEGHVIERRASGTIASPTWLEPNTTTIVTTDTSPAIHEHVATFNQEEGFPSAKLHIQTSATSAMPRITLQPLTKHRNHSEQNFENTEVEELIAMLRETENLEEQGDILQYLVDTQGLDYNTGMPKITLLGKFILMLFVIWAVRKEKKWQNFA